MASPFRLLALDIDGTLLRTDKTISPRTLLALRAARERGVRLVLVTGRRLRAARPRPWATWTSCCTTAR